MFVSVFVIAIVAWKLSGALAQKWVLKEDAVQPLATTLVLSVAAVLTSTSALRSYTRTTSEMSRSSARHPFCAFHLVGYRGVGIPVPVAQADVQVRLRGLQSIEEVHRREKSQLKLRVDIDALAQSERDDVPRKVILVVVECLRPEVIEASTMPNLHAFAQRSIVLANNYASGNATCHSMFGLVTGLESVWFPRQISHHPPLNRLLREAGFELAFFGGQTDWMEYRMDGFINPTQFDSFFIEEPDLPGSDLRAVERTVEFIEARDLSESRKQERIEAENGLHRAAICYLYATHSRFRYSDPQDQIFLPAASESVLMSRSGDLRDQFYNRYKNSLHTMDRMLAPLLREDCVVMVMGDHGEPFLDDGTAIHGTRLSRFQNMTPALIYYPGVKPQQIRVPTFHADLLPTLLSILKIPLTDWSVFDGRDLLGTDQQVLSERTFLSSNFLDSTSVLIGPWSADPSQPFGFRVNFDIHQWLSAYLNPIDDQGYEWEPGAESSFASTGKEEFRRWMVDRFGPESVDESRSVPEMFTKFFHSQDTETRFAALRIAATVAEPEDYLYELITRSTRDEVPEIRNFAKELVIQINRFRGRAPDPTSSPVVHIQRSDD
jgi:membrane-anchored protein YejM (alkaline phosphatase superfamily)